VHSIDSDCAMRQATGCCSDGSGAQVDSAGRQLCGICWKIARKMLTRPREDMAGAPMRTPPGVIADTSPTTAFLLSVMCARSHTLSILLPVTPCSGMPHQSVSDQALCIHKLPITTPDVHSR
jgi:hypothetical protein